jgi:hypothetical protein
MIKVNKNQADTARKQSEQRQRQSSTKTLDKPKHRSGSSVRNLLTSPAPVPFSAFHSNIEALPHIQQHKQARTRPSECNSKLDFTIFKFSTIVKRGQEAWQILRAFLLLKVKAVFQRSILRYKDLQDRKLIFKHCYYKVGS